MARRRFAAQVRSLLAFAEIAAPSLGGYLRQYAVEGARSGTLYLFESSRYVFHDADGTRSTGEWHSVDGSILVFDHYFHTDDNGRTFFSYQVKLTLQDKSNGDWPNSDALSSSFAKRAYAVPRLMDRTADLFDVLPKGGIVAELGVELGLFASVILAQARPERLHLIDCWDAIPSPWLSADQELAKYSGVVERFSHDMGTGRVVVHKGDDLQILSTFPDHHFDWVYIDTTHQYEQTSRELHAAASKVKESGFICGHDYVDNRLSRRHGFGVIIAVDEFVLQSEWEYAYLTRDEFASFVLRRRSR